MIASDYEIRVTLRLLQERSEKTINRIFSKLLHAEEQGMDLLSCLNENDFVDLKRAHEAYNVFENMRIKYADPIVKANILKGKK